MLKLYLYLVSITVTVHVSEKYPTMHNPNNYGLNTCTGVWVSPDEVLTAGHCVSESRGYQWIKTEGKSFSATVEKADYAEDLALLRIKSPPHKYVKLGKPEYITEKVYEVHSGDGDENTWNEGVVNNIIGIEDSTQTFIEHTASIIPGASGGGLFDRHGKLIGVNTLFHQPFAYAVRIEDIRKFLTDK